MTGLAFLGGALLGLGLCWLLAELVVRAVLEWPLARDFYGSIGRDRVRELQCRFGVRGASGTGWIHLGWVADPDRERYVVEWRSPEGWREVGRSVYGSFLIRNGGGTYRVRALARSGPGSREVGVADLEPRGRTPPLRRPRIGGPWRPLFRPRVHGRYVNDHALYRDRSGRWRLIGITSPTDGDFDAERWFAVGVSDGLPPEGEMDEEDPVADLGELAWAPWVLEEEGRWHLLWSPHRLHQMTSDDGIRWERHRVTLKAPFHRFFRDAMVMRVAPGQWLLYCTARGRYFSRIDVYQSFDLEHWQYVRPALRTGFGSERNSPFASTESPSVVDHEGRYYLSVTYNNDSFFWPGIAMWFRRWRDPTTYNDTRVFHSDNPYDFGIYRGRRRAPSLIARLEAHAPRLVRHPETGDWWITTAGWPWVATLTSGEVAIAPLRWEDPGPAPGPPPRM